MLQEWVRIRLLHMTGTSLDLSLILGGYPFFSEENLTETTLSQNCIGDGVLLFESLKLGLGLGLG